MGHHYVVLARTVGSVDQATADDEEDSLLTPKQGGNAGRPAAAGNAAQPSGPLPTMSGLRKNVAVKESTIPLVIFGEYMENMVIYWKHMGTIW